MSDGPTMRIDPAVVTVLGGFLALLACTALGAMLGAAFGGRSGLAGGISVGFFLGLAAAFMVGRVVDREGKRQLRAEWAARNEAEDDPWSSRTPRRGEDA